MLLTRNPAPRGRPGPRGTAFRRLARPATGCAGALLPWAAVTAALLLVVDAGYEVATAPADGVVLALLELGVELAMAVGCLALAAALLRDRAAGPSDGHR